MLSTDPVKMKKFPSITRACKRTSSDVRSDMPLELYEAIAFIFQSATFKEANFRVVELTKVFRQVRV